MPWLFIDSAKNLELRAGILDGEKVFISTHEGRSHIVLSTVAKLVKPTIRKKLEGICVVSGPGSFTSIRTGVLVANLLSKLWKLPLVGVTREQAEDAKALSVGLAAGAYPSSDRILPTYDAEPNITIPTT